MLTYINNYLKNNRIVKRISVLASGTVLAQLVSIIALPFITRLFTPAEMGVAALYLTFIGFWLNTIAFRYDHALVIATDDVESHLLVRLSTFLVVLMSILAMPVLLLLQEDIFFEIETLSNWVPLLVMPILLGSGLSLIYRSWALRGGLIKEISRATVLRSLTLSGTKISIGQLGGGVIGLLIAELVGAFTSTLNLMRA
jgi:O-antigen/teichoic acid export membrane protein